MDVLLQGLGSAGFFAARAFLPAFVTALALRLGPDLPWLADSELLAGLPEAPTWFTAWPTIFALGLLAGAESLAARSADARALLDGFHHWLKPALAVLTYLGVAGAADEAFIEGTLKKAGFGDGLFAAAVGLATYWLGSLRGALFGLLAEGDEDDDAGVQGLLGWAEDLWAATGPILLVLFPLAMAALVGLTTGALWLARRRAESREDAARVPCAACGAPTYACAMACGACGAALASPREIGFFGTSQEQPAPDLHAHPQHLAAKKRCPTCATRLPERDPRQACPACARRPFADEAFTERYLAAVRARLPRVLLVCLLCSLVPVAGLLPGVIYYRIALVGPFRRYIPRGRSLLMKWGIRLLFIVLVAVQWIPAVGGVVVPAMAIVNYLAWRALFVAALQEPAPARATA